MGRAAARTGWSPRMLRYLEHQGLVVPSRTSGGFRLYGPREIDRLQALRELRKRFRVEISDLAFAARLRREPALRTAVESWLSEVELEALTWEQRKHERLLAA